MNRSQIEDDGGITGQQIARNRLPHIMAQIDDTAGSQSGLQLLCVRLIDGFLQVNKIDLFRSIETQECLGQMCSDEP